MLKCSANSFEKLQADVASTVCLKVFIFENDWLWDFEFPGEFKQDSLR